MIFKSKNHDEKQKSADEKSADFLTNIYSEARNLGGETVQDKAR